MTWLEDQHKALADIWLMSREVNAMVYSIMQDIVVGLVDYRGDTRQADFKAECDGRTYTLKLTVRRLKREENDGY
jgi:hypothetical protein